MTFIETYLAMPAWQFIATIAIVFLLDPLVNMNTVQSEIIQKHEFNFVVYFLSCAISIIAFYVLNNLIFENSSVTLTYTAHIFWSISLIQMVLTYEIHYIFGLALIFILVAGTTFNVLEVANINMLDKIDLAMGFVPQPKSPVVETQDVKGFLSGLRDKIYVKPSQIILFITYFINILIPLHYFGTIYRLYRAGKGKSKRENIHDDALIKAVTVFSTILAAVLSFIFCGADIFQIGIVTAILGAGFSIAAKDLVANFAAGMVLMWDNSIKRDDVITVDGRGYGWVEEISMRYTKIIDRNEMNVLVPNLQLINGRIENWTQSNNFVRLKLDIEVAYDTNLKQAMDIMMDCCYHVPRVLRIAPHRPNALVFAAEDSGIKLQLRFWISDPKKGIRNVMSDVYLYLFDRFSQATPKIDIPFNQLEVRRVFPDIERPIKTPASS